VLTIASAGLLPRSRSRRAPMPARHLWAWSPATRSWLRCLPWTSRAAFPELCTGRGGDRPLQAGL